jgi:hypothetical protein
VAPSAVPGTTRAARLTAPLRPLDGAVNAVADACDRAVPWLWWPLDPPDRGTPHDARRHALYAAHWAVLGVVSWALFTGAWDRRAHLTARRAGESLAP